MSLLIVFVVAVVVVVAVVEMEVALASIESQFQCLVYLRLT